MIIRNQKLDYIISFDNSVKFRSRWKLNNCAFIDANRNEKMFNEIVIQNIGFGKEISFNDSRLTFYIIACCIFLLPTFFIFLVVIYFALMTSVLYQKKYKHNSLIFYSHWYARFNIEAMTFICCFWVVVQDKKMG